MAYSNVTPHLPQNVVEDCKKALEAKKRQYKSAQKNLNDVRAKNEAINPAQVAAARAKAIQAKELELEALQQSIQQADQAELAAKDQLHSVASLANETQPRRQRIDDDIRTVQNELRANEASQGGSMV